ncbi:uncharacterized protein PITG_22000 [Phytophthora infestans T30-4]|uniref:Transcription factor TFIIIC triple barrel domain-containing protein n=1 Tax=Phytophthora infestans (strain T30-4) TaxID=403677 RepID=D0P4V9_PHYIT|nr:uncharacterized protein PITG_22000 [Phytophthora infestans T30-4]EEY52990.1 conserved hypothetical protein [Phytophthora infestans T30-4]|eukprot:XP_002894739.1 conserved hypothetical protein [Phytophthora infestans T30-4]
MPTKVKTRRRCWWCWSYATLRTTHCSMTTALRRLRCENCSMGIDTARPMLKIGEYELHEQLEETVGTSYFYDTDTSRVPDKTYQFAGQTIKKIKFTIAPPEDA